MANINKAFYKIITGNIDFCNICFKDVENTDAAVNIYDKVMLGGMEVVQISDILISILDEPLIYDSLFGVFCQECIKLAIRSYKFKLKCQDNFNRLSRIVNLTSNSIQKDLIQDPTLFRTLYITLGTDSLATKQIYVVGSYVDSCKEALEKLKEIQERPKKDPNVHSITIDLAPDHADHLGTPCISDNSNLKQKYKVQGRIGTSEMLYDKNDKKNYKCKVCKKIYPTSYNLRQHYMRMHAPKKYQCPKCPRTYGSAAILEQHKYQSHTDVICTQCGKTYNNRYSLKGHELSHQVQYECNECNRVFKCKNSLTKHIEQRKCEEPRQKPQLQGKFICNMCNKKFCLKPSLRTHIELEHGERKGHECSWCKKKFSAPSRLKAHVVKHTQQKDFGCEICGGKFVTKESLVYHTRIHTGERPYSCDVCNQRFLSASRRTEHVRRHHSGSNVSSIICDMCPTNFKSKSSLKRHRRRHFQNKLDNSKPVDNAD